MLFTRLRYTSYRNLKQVELQPAERFNVFWGRNAQGKTNLLEGIYLLGHLKSFRTALSQNLIGHDSSQAEIRGELVSGSVQHQLDLSLTRQGKEIHLDGKRPSRIGDIARVMRQVLFAPEEVGCVKGAPGLRRNMLDRAIFQVEPGYLERMQSYYRVLKQRNTLLREGRGDPEIDIWSVGLSEEGARIYFERQRFMEQLQPLFEEVYRQLTDDRELPEVRLRQGISADLEGQQQVLDEECKRNRKQERLRGTTLAGPHRDDPVFLVNGEDLRNRGSQGQQRTFVLAFKVALLKLLRERNGKNAVLMLDDIASELDRKRREALFSMLRHEAGQVFVTTTDPELLRSEASKDGCFFEVRDGQISASSTTLR